MLISWRFPSFGVAEEKREVEPLEEVTTCVGFFILVPTGHLKPPGILFGFTLAKA